MPALRTVKPYLGKVVGPVSGKVVEVETDFDKLRGSMDLEFYSGDIVRAGTAIVGFWDRDRSVILLPYNLNVTVPAVCTGDHFREWTQPCTRCRCEQCDAAFAAMPPIGTPEKP